MPPTRFTVTPAEAGLRIDAFLVARQIAPSAAAARRLLDVSGARVDGRRGRKGDRLVAGQTVELTTAPAPPPTPVPPVPPLVILHVDEALVAVAKPAGVPVHPLDAATGPAGTLAEALLARFPECAGAGADPREAGFAHRLDTGTSGVILAARRAEVYQALRRTLAGGGSDKRYVAEVVGVPRGLRAPGDAVVVDVPIGRRGRRAATVVLGKGRGLLPARTDVRLVTRRDQTALVEARLAAGRAHQVRVHLAYLGAPVFGDRLYGDAAAVALADTHGVAEFHLHAHELRLPHPMTGLPLVITAPLPDWARTG